MTPGQQITHNTTLTVPGSSQYPVAYQSDGHPQSTEPSVSHRDATYPGQTIPTISAFESMYCSTPTSTNISTSHPVVQSTEVNEKTNDNKKKNDSDPSLENELTETQEETAEDNRKEEGEITDTEEEEETHIVTSDITELTVNNQQPKMSDYVLEDISDADEENVETYTSVQIEKSQETCVTKASEAAEETQNIEKHEQPIISDYVLEDVSDADDENVEAHTSVQIEKSQDPCVTKASRAVEETQNIEKSKASVVAENNSIENSLTMSSKSSSLCKNNLEADSLKSLTSASMQAAPRTPSVVGSTVAKTYSVTELAPSMNPIPQLIHAYPVIQRTFTTSGMSNVGHSRRQVQHGGFQMQTIPLGQQVHQPMPSNQGGVPLMSIRPQALGNNVAIVQPMHPVMQHLSSHRAMVQAGQVAAQPKPLNGSISQSPVGMHPAPINVQPRSVTVASGSARSQMESSSTNSTKPKKGASFGDAVPTSESLLINVPSTPSVPLNRSEGRETNENAKQTQPGCPVSSEILEYCRDVVVPQSADNCSNPGMGTPDHTVDTRVKTVTSRAEPQLSKNRQYRMSPKDPRFSPYLLQWIQLLVDDNRVSHKLFLICTCECFQNVSAYSNKVHTNLNINADMLTSIMFQYILELGVRQVA